MECCVLLFFFLFSLSRISYRSENKVSTVRAYTSSTHVNIYTRDKNSFLYVRKLATSLKAPDTTLNLRHLSSVSSLPSSSLSLSHSRYHSSARTKRHERSCRSTPITSGNTPLLTRCTRNILLYI